MGALQLPTKVMASVLEDQAVQKMPPGFKTALADFARSGKAVAVPLATLQLVESSARKVKEAEGVSREAVPPAELSGPAAPVLLDSQPEPATSAETALPSA